MRHIHAVVMLYHTAAGHHTVAPGHFLGSKVGIPDNGENFLYLEFPKSVFLTGDSRFRSVPLMPVGFLEQVAYLDHPAVSQLL